MEVGIGIGVKNKAEVKRILWVVERAGEMGELLTDDKA